MRHLKVERPKKRIAPRLANGESRTAVYAAWPDDVKEGLRAIAEDENKSMNWVVEEVVIRFFHLKRPVYVKTAKASARVLPMRKRA